MKRHNRNISLLQDISGYSFQHRRSLSYNRYQNNANIMPNMISPENLISDSGILPNSYEMKRLKKEGRKTLEKEGLIRLHDKKMIKSKDKDKEQNSKNKKLKQKPKSIKQKKSNEKSGMANKNGSHQIVKNRKSIQKIKMEKSIQKKIKNSQQMISNEIHKNQKIKIEKNKSNKKKQIQSDFASNWEEIIEEYHEYLLSSQINEIKQYKWIYFLGKIRQRKINSLPQTKFRRGSEKQINQSIPYKQKNHSFEESTEKISQESNKNQLSQDQFYHYEIGDHIAYRYEIIQSINQGSFGEVIKVYDHKGKEYLALKIVKKCQQLVQQTFVEITILTHIKEKDKANMSGIVRIKDFTIFRNHICIVFELLEGNLYQLLIANNYNGLNQDVIRIFAVQILNSLNFLQKQKIIHCDIKPENIVMKTWGKTGVKLVDFGTSCFAGQQVYEYLQSRYYRAPQVIMGKQYSYEIDIWSFGCLLIQLKLGEPIFAGSTNLEQLMYISNSIGYPSEGDGTYSKQFLANMDMKIIVEQNYLELYKKMEENGSIETHQFFSKCKYIKTCMKTLKQRLKNSKGYKQDSQFVNFLLKIFVWQPSLRLKPQQALKEPWILKGLSTQIKQLYTIFNSTQFPQDSKSKSKQSKNSKNKKTSKKSRSQKNKSKEFPTHRQKQTRSNQIKLKESSNQKRQGNSKHASGSLTQR